MSFHQLLSPHCATFNMALPPFYSSGRLIGWKRETWRRVGIKALVAPCRAIHHGMTVHWSGGMVVKPTHCLLIRAFLLLRSLPTRPPPRTSQLLPCLPFPVFFVSSQLAGCSTGHTKDLSTAGGSGLSVEHAGQRPDLLITAGRDWERED